MALHTIWQDTRQTILLTTYGNEWTWDDFEQHNRQVIRPMLVSVPQQIALIADMRQSTWLKPDKLIHNIREARSAFAEQIDVVVFSLADRTVGALLVTAFSRYHPQRRYLTAASVEEAYDLVVQQFSYT